MIVIPTFNRSAKLERTLRFYKQTGVLNGINICVLDGSDQSHMLKNRSLCEELSVEYVSESGSTLLDRLWGFINNLPDDEIIALGNDEDCFHPDYLKHANVFLKNNPEYVTFIGKYITFEKPLFKFLKRVSYRRNVITNFDINSDDPSCRISTLDKILIAGCSPVYFSMRRAGNFKKSILAQKSSIYETSQEVVDQITLAIGGKIYFSEDVMLLRDETKIDYQYYWNRHDEETYFNDECMLLAQERLTKEYPKYAASLESFFEVRNQKIKTKDDQQTNLLLEIHRNVNAQMLPRNGFLNLLVRYVVLFNNLALRLLSEYLLYRSYRSQLERELGKAVVSDLFTVIGTNKL